MITSLGHAPGRPQPYRDRHEAGRILASRFPRRIRFAGDSVILALPRGGVPVGFEIARALEAPLDVLIVRKLGAPETPEMAIGAIASGGHELLNHALIAELGIPGHVVADVARIERMELQRREALYRAERPRIEVEGRRAILVDDGLATGFTMRAAIAAVRRRGAAQIVVAAPVGARDTCYELGAEVDELICPLQPEPFHAVGLWYEKFSQTTDEGVQECLAAARQTTAGR